MTNDAVPIDAPTSRRALLERPALLDRLDGVLDRPLTLVTAPAGYGKTTLAAQWGAARCPIPVTWWSIRSAVALAALPAVLPDGPVVAVVDGLEGEGTPSALVALVDSLGRDRPDVHLLVLARRPFGPELATLRLDGRLDVLQARDLRLDAGELGRLVGGLAGTEPSTSVAAAVCDELEGWMAGAVLLALDWDPATTTEDHRLRLDAGYRAIRNVLASTLVDQLGEELLAALRSVACLPELQPDLIDAVTGRTIGHTLVEHLHTVGAFTGPTDFMPDGVRLHPLVRSALRDGRLRLSVDESAVMAAAVDWCRDQHLPLSAGLCLVEAGRWEDAVALIQANLLDLLAEDRLRDLARIAALVPAAALRQHFSWTLSLAWLSFEAKDTGSALAIIATAQREATVPQLITSECTSTMAIARLEDPTPCLVAAEHAMALCDEVGTAEVDYEDLITVSRTTHWHTYARCAALLAGAYIGEWERVAMHDGPIDGATAVEIPAMTVMMHRGRRAQYLALSGRMAEAEREARHALHFAPIHDLGTDRAKLQVLYALAEAARNRLELDEAAVHLLACLERARDYDNLNVLAVAAASGAALHLDAGRPDEALRLLQEHRASTQHHPPPTIEGLLAAAEGRALQLTGAKHRARHVLASAPRTSAVATAQALGAFERRDLAEAADVLEAWPDEPTVTSAVHRGLVAAAVAEGRGDRRSAQREFHGALGLAYEHQLHRPVHDFGVHVLHLLRAAARDDDGPSVLAEQIAASIDRSASAVVRLSPRETLVLHHLADGVTLPELAGKLTVSVNTVKSQLRSVYRKLGVSGREQAVAVWRSSPDGPGPATGS